MIGLGREHILFLSGRSACDLPVPLFLRGANRPVEWCGVAGDVADLSGFGSHRTELRGSATTYAGARYSVPGVENRDCRSQHPLLAHLGRSISVEHRSGTNRHHAVAGVQKRILLRHGDDLGGPNVGGDGLGHSQGQATRPSANAPA